ncbi:RidA family protein [Proteus columbae]|uniref:RidA family protein n=1 Tax=Proteus columbae TaxID=1987580 RepID=UPI00200B3CB0|nr:RidA family protein [Proteus columbae]MCK9780429.1 RidA family protein [Proteus columbae]
MRYKSLLVALPFIFGVASANAEGVVHHKLNGMPISESVEVSAGNNLIFLSGKVPAKKSADAPEGVLASYGNTEEQTISVLEQIKTHLNELGLDMKDVVKMQVFLVGGEETKGEMDFKGFMDGYSKYFDASKTEQLPARSTFQIAKLANPAWRVEIEVIAVRPAK